MDASLFYISVILCRALVIKSGIAGYEKVRFKNKNHNGIMYQLVSS
jgi:hypothetical protein